MTHDYKKLGLKAGLEIHQQLNTSKLFCDCPSILRSDEPNYTIKRKLNPVVGETGKIDIAATYEASKNSTFNYQVHDTVCLVELDEEPPHKINSEALDIALQISLLLNCKVFPVAQIMRKTVVNGSNTSGFQRTVMIAHDGFIETSHGKISIDAVMLEEDSARPVSQDENSKTYRLDRLGIPLVEIATGPHMHTPEAIKEAALKLGEILRACNVRRGIGTIRQDVNVSIKGSKRVEIKGFQDPKMMIETVNQEISRQIDCINNKSCKNEVRNALPNGSTEFLRPMPGSSRMYPETDVSLLKIPSKKIDELKKTLPKLASEHKSYLSEFGLNDELIKVLLKNSKVDDFKTLTNTSKDYDLIAKMLTLFQDGFKESLDTDILESILEEVDKKISKNDVRGVMKKLSSGMAFNEAIQKADIDLDSEIKALIEEKPGLSQGAYMGLIMGKFKGKVSGSEVMDSLKKYL